MNRSNIFISTKILYNTNWIRKLWNAKFTKLLNENVTVDSWDGPAGVLSVALDGITGDVGVVVAPTPELSELMLNVLVTE